MTPKPDDQFMHCPVCNRDFDPTDSTALPFCCERCRTIDLGRWLDESYGLPHLPDASADEAAELDPATDRESA